jgi:hypothetical protein
MTAEIPFVIPPDLAAELRAILERRPLTGRVALDFHKGTVGSLEIVERVRHDKYKAVRR